MENVTTAVYIQHAVPQLKSLKPLRQFADDITPFFAVAAFMVALATLFVGLQVAMGPEILGIMRWYATYISALVTLGPPMLIAFVFQWAFHRWPFEPIISSLFLAIVGCFWLIFLSRMPSSEVVTPLIRSGVSMPGNYTLMMSGWLVWLVARALLIRLRPRPITLKIWRWAWHLALLPTVYLVGVQSAQLFYVWVATPQWIVNLTPAVALFVTCVFTIMHYWALRTSKF